jgi:hypothetical protein
VKIRFVFVMLACLALSCRIVCAGEPASDGRPDQSGDHTARKEQKSGPGDRANLSVPGLLKSQAHSKSSNPPNPRQNLEGSSPHAKSAPVQAARAGHPTPVRPLPGFSRPVASPLTSLHHRGANPAVITGSAQFANRNTGKLDGAEVHRRP